MKKILSVLLCVTLVAVGVFAFSGCTKTSDLKYDVALITDGGSIHDKAYNQSAWDGVQTYANENSAKAVYYQPALEENQELTTDVVEQYVKLAVDKGAKYIVLPGETFAVICYELATMYPELHFVLLDAVPHSAGDKSARLLPNVMSASFDDLQSGRLFCRASGEYQAGLPGLGAERPFLQLWCRICTGRCRSGGYSGRTGAVGLCGL